MQSSAGRVVDARIYLIRRLNSSNPIIKPNTHVATKGRKARPGAGTARAAFATRHVLGRPNNASNRPQQVACGSIVSDGYDPVAPRAKERRCEHQTRTCDAKNSRTNESIGRPGISRQPLSSCPHSTRPTCGDATAEPPPVAVAVAVVVRSVRPRARTRSRWPENTQDHARSGPKTTPDTNPAHGAGPRRI